MAILKVHFDVLKDPELYDMIYDYCGSIEKIGQEKDVVIFRVEGEDIPEGDRQIAFNAIRLCDKVRPIILEIDKY